MLVTRHSLKEALELLDREPPDGDGASAKTGRDRSWDLGVNYPGMVKLARQGWNTNIHGFGDLLASNDEVIVHPPSWVYGVSGAAVDIGRLVEGEPECMIDYPIDEPEQKLVRVLVNLGSSWHIDAEHKKNYGLAVSGFVSLLQALGYAVYLEVFDLTSRRGDTHFTGVTISKPEDYIDLPTAIFWISHPAAYRRGFFRLFEHNSADVRNTFGYWNGEGYGSPADLSSDAQEQIFGDEKLVVFPYLQDNSMPNIESAVAEVRRVAEEAGFILR